MAHEGYTAPAAEEGIGVPGPSHPPSVLEPPLCVDFDGTLFAGDSLWESLLIVAKNRPFDVLRIPVWILKGKAQFKQEVASRATLDVSLLPYRADVLEFLREQKRSGRHLVLATAAHRSVADAVAAHLPLFDEVAATEGKINLSGQVKLAELEKRFGSGNFDYIGDSSADLCLWQAARNAYLVAPGRRLSSRAARVCTPRQVFGSRPTASAALRALRPLQWVKNFLVILPLILSHQWMRFGAAGSAFVAFCLCASAIYILNDLLDLDADRRHPRKRKRPLAAGELSVRFGIFLSGSLLIAGFLFAALLPPKFVALLAVYVSLTTAYSFWLKRKLLLDVILLASLYTLRLIAGAAGIDVPMTMWLLAFSMFFFLSLAFAKRYSELLGVEDAGDEKIKGREYRVSDLRIIESVGPCSGYLSVLVFCNYLDSNLVRQLYPRPWVLWLAAPLLLYWITRIWFMARRRKMLDDPIIFAIRDRVSLLAGLLAALLVLAAWAPLPRAWKF